MQTYTLLSLLMENGQNYNPLVVILILQQLGKPNHPFHPIIKHCILPEWLIPLEEIWIFTNANVNRMALGEILLIWVILSIRQEMKNLRLCTPIVIPCIFLLTNMSDWAAMIFFIQK